VAAYERRVDLFSASDRLVRVHVYAALIALFLAAIFGVLQAVARAPGLYSFLPFSYYQVLTAHGTLMALIFTTFFIIGFMVFGVNRTLARPLGYRALAWIGYFLMLLGTLMAVFMILWGHATVLYTFYAPLQAHPAFYIGLTLLVAGSWLVGWAVIHTYQQWRRNHKNERIPLVTHGILATLILWFVSSVGAAASLIFQLIPWSMGIIPRIDPLLTRTLFWYFGHALVYFWLIPALVIWVGFGPRIAGGKLFSDPLARLSFLLLLVLSTPVGLHHQFEDAGIHVGWKYLQTINTFAVSMPSIITGFTLTASLEIAARARGGKGLFRWVGSLPWGDAKFAPLALSMIMFAFGGFSGLVNGGFNLNALVHNTVWVVGHFHLQVGTAVALTFMGTTYWLLPAITHKPLWGPRVAVAQAYLWFGGMLLMSGLMHFVGLSGSPRRTADVTYGGNPEVAGWALPMDVAAIGGILLFISILFFVSVVVMTLLSERGEIEDIPLASALSGPDQAPRLFDNWAFWTGVTIVLILISYAVPLAQIALSGAPGSPGFVTW